MRQNRPPYMFRCWHGRAHGHPAPHSQARPPASSALPKLAVAVAFRPEVHAHFPLVRRCAGRNRQSEVVHTGPQETRCRGGLRHPPEAAQPAVTARGKVSGQPIEANRADLHDWIDCRRMRERPEEGVQLTVVRYRVAGGACIEERRAVLCHPQQDPDAALGVRHPRPAR